MKLKKAVIPVAGLGTRFLPATKAVPKELLPIIDIPSIQYVVQEAVDSGIQEIIFVTGRGKDGLSFYRQKPVNVDSGRIGIRCSVKQRESPIGRIQVGSLFQLPSVYNGNRHSLFRPNDL